MSERSDALDRAQGYVTLARIKDEHASVLLETANTAKQKASEFVRLRAEFAASQSLIEAKRLYALANVAVKEADLAREKAQYEIIFAEDAAA